jgi:hypothetical protein
MRLAAVLLALASCAVIEDTADRSAVSVHLWTWHFPAGLHRPVRHYFPYALPEDRP